LRFNGILQPTNIQLNVFGTVLNDLLAGTPTTLAFVGRKSSFDIEWVKLVTQTLKYFLTVPVGTKVQVVSKVGLDVANLKFYAAKNPTLSTTVQFTHNIPFLFTFTVPRVSLDSKFELDGTAFASYPIDFVASSRSGNLISLPAPEATLTPLATGPFTTVVTRIFTSGGSNFVVNGKAVFVLKTAVGEVRINADILHPTFFGGLAGMKSVKPLIIGFSIESQQQAQLNCVLNLNISNPSTGTYGFETLTFDATPAGGSVSPCPVVFAAMKPGINTLPGSLALQASPAVNQFLGQVIAGASPAYDFKGKQAGTPISLVKEGFGQIQFSAGFNGSRVIRDAAILVTFDNIVNNRNNLIALSLRNPHGVSLNLKGTLRATASTLTFNKTSPVVLGTTTIDLTVNPRALVTQRVEFVQTRTLPFEFFSSIFGDPAYEVQYAGTLDLKFGTFAAPSVAFSTKVPTTFLAN